MSVCVCMGGGGGRGGGRGGERDRERGLFCVVGDFLLARHTCRTVRRTRTRVGDVHSSLSEPSQPCSHGEQDRRSIHKKKTQVGGCPLAQCIRYGVLTQTVPFCR